MIDEKRLAELQGVKMLIHTMDACEIYDTIDSLLKIARAAQWLSNRLHTDGGTLPGEIDNLDEALSVLTPVEDKEKA